MNRSFFPSIACFTLVAILVPGLVSQSFAQAADDADDWEDNSLPLFDGETVAGWEGNAYWFRIEDGSLVAGRLNEEIPHNEFLCTTQNYDDFELRFEAKLVGEGNNAGVQFRSKRIPNSTEVSGYQADIGEAWDRPVWGRCTTSHVDERCWPSPILNSPERQSSQANGTRCE